jgi:hypothetical protein
MPSIRAPLRKIQVFLNTPVALVFANGTRTMPINPQLTYEKQLTEVLSHIASYLIGTIQLFRHGFVTGPTPLCTPEKGFAARSTVIAFTF